MLAASTAVLNLHAISRHSQGTSRINVGKLIAGSGRNVIPSYALMQLETRGETEAVNQFASEEAKRILHAAALMYQVEIELIKMEEAGQAVGDQEWAKQLQFIFSSMSSIHSVQDTLSLGASEDVVYMMKRVQEHGGVATYLVFGSPLAAMHHQGQFDFNEEVLKIAIEGYIRIIMNVFGQ